MDKESMQNIIAKRVAKELKNNSIVNLGIGLPTRVVNFIPDNINITLQSENGFLGLGSKDLNSIDETIVNAGGSPVSILLGGAFFDSATSFGMIRGGHIDVTILGAFQVAENGDVANYMIPNKMIPGMGGAMDLVVGAKKVIIAMEHTSKGLPKILKKCTLPLTGVNVVNLIITEMAVIEVTKDGLLLLEVNENYTLDDVINSTEASLKVCDSIK